MLKIEKTAADRVELVLDGTLDAEAMRAGVEDLIAASEDVSHGKLLYIIEDFALPTLSAIAVELGMLPRLFSLVTKFDKCAVLADQGWLRKAAEIEGTVIPGLEIKSFERHELAAANAWLEATD